MAGRGETVKVSLIREGLGAGPPSGCCHRAAWPSPPTLPRAQARPLVKVLLPHVAAIQHEDIQDVDRTDLPLGLPLEGQVHCPPCQASAWAPSAHRGRLASFYLQREKGRALNTGYFCCLPPS